MENDHVPDEVKPAAVPPWNKGKLIGASRRCDRATFGRSDEA
jgi:hypothetical protein